MIESLMPQLDKLGLEGWELVHMEPVPRVGKKGNVLLGASSRLPSSRGRPVWLLPSAARQLPELPGAKIDFNI